jgi:penicillin-binding protein 1A
VVSDVISDLTRTYGYSRAEASHLLYHGGLRIYTLIDPDLQAIVEDYYINASNFPRLENGKAPQSAIVVLDPASGNLLAVAGAIGEKKGDRVYNFATDAKRPPGSVLKPLSVYAPALQDGLIGYASVYDDVPVRFPTDSKGNTSMWPHNASGIYRGLSTVNDAVSRSLNTVSVRILQKIGIDRSFRFLKEQLGITSLEDGKGNGITDRGEAALALGQLSYGASLREITAAYTAFSNGGVYRNARTYLRVTDSTGRILLENEAISRPVLSAENAAIMTKMLENVVKNGTARTLTLSDRVAVAGKTGTTQYSFDRWFVGYTPSLLAGVWYGYEYPESLSGIDGNPALSIFDRVMHALTDRIAKSEKSLRTAFSYPHLRTARVCADSGLLISDACTRDPRGDRSVLAYFAEGTVPTAFCTCHTDVPYRGLGSDAGDGIPMPDSDSPEQRLVGLIRVDRRFPIEVTVSDAQYSIPRYTNAPKNTEDPRRSFFCTDVPPYAGRSNVRYPFNRPATKARMHP